MNKYSTQYKIMLTAPRAEHGSHAASPSVNRRTGVGIACVSAIALSVTTTVASGESVDVEAKLKQLLPAEATIDGISESEMPGVYEVTVGGKTIYVHATEGHVLIGDAYDIEKRESLLDAKQAEQMSQVMSNSNVDEMIVMGPDAPKRHITIFTDVDCGYCRKLHAEVPALNEAGVEIRYLMFPRAGVDTESFAKAVSVWCADDQAEAITIAKNGGEVAPAVCENPVEAQYKLGITAGVRGTPTMILDDGTVIPGYVPKDKLLAELGLTSE